MIEAVMKDLRRHPQFIGKTNSGKLSAICLWSSSVRLCWLIRIATSQHRAISLISRKLLQNIYDIELHPTTKIGAGFYLPHPTGIIIGPGVSIGENVTLGQRVTIGGNHKKCVTVAGVNKYEPTIGSNVWIGPNAVLGGPICVGSDVLISANAVITKDIPANKIAGSHNVISTNSIQILPFEHTYKKL